MSYIYFDSCCDFFSCGLGYINRPEKKKKSQTLGVHMSSVFSCIFPYVSQNLV